MPFKEQEQVKEVVDVIVDRVLDCDNKLKTDYYDTYRQFIEDFGAIFDLRGSLSTPDPEFESELVIELTNQLRPLTISALESKIAA